MNEQLNRALSSCEFDNEVKLFACSGFTDTDSFLVPASGLKLVALRIADAEKQTEASWLSLWLAPLDRRSCGGRGSGSMSSALAPVEALLNLFLDAARVRVCVQRLLGTSSVQLQKHGRRTYNHHCCDDCTLCFCSTCVCPAARQWLLQELRQTDLAWL